MNRIVGNVYIIDSQTGADRALINGTSGAWLDNTLVTAFAFWGADTTGAFEMVFAHQTDATAFRCGHSLVNPNMNWSNFGQAIYFKELRCKTLTAGTGFIYFL